LTLLYGDPCEEAKFDALKLVLVAYSGGTTRRLMQCMSAAPTTGYFGVVLLDTLYGETDTSAREGDHRQQAI
jgi:hypothetical protein